MDQANDKERKHLKFVGVLTQFCLLSASKKQKITFITRHGQHKQNKQDNMEDKFMKGLGVSLAKTPSVVWLKNKTDAPKAGTPWQIFLACCAVWYSGEHSGMCNW